MTTMVSVEKAKQDLDKLLIQLPLGETLTLVDANGAPTAVVVSLKEPRKPAVMTSEEWMAPWETLAKDIGDAWIGEPNAVNAVAEMRR